MVPRPNKLAWAGLLLAGFGLIPTPGMAQPERRVAVVYLGVDTSAADGSSQIWRVHVERAARMLGLEPEADPVRWATERIANGSGVMPARVQAFHQVEALLLAARQDASALRERAALAKLASAERIAEAHPDVPGAASWIAEIQTAIGIVAAQAGMDALARVALARGATLDSSRGVRAAEAPPAVVEQAAAIRRSVATGPSGSFEVSCDAEGARVFVDDAVLGEAPRTIRVPVGRHVLRVEAPGRLPYGAVLQVLEGSRPGVHVELAADPLIAAARRMSSSARGSDLAEAVQALAVFGAAALWVVEIGAGERGRALLTACGLDGCAPTRRLEVDEVPIVLGAQERLPPDQVALALAGARIWLGEPGPLPPPPPPTTPVWRRWYVLAATGAVLLAGGLWVASALRPDPDEGRRVVIEFD